MISEGAGKARGPRRASRWWIGSLSLLAGLMAHAAARGDASKSPPRIIDCCTSLTKAQCDVLDAHYRMVLANLALADGVVQRELTMEKVVIARSWWLRRTIEMTGTDFLMRLRTLLAQIEDGSYRVRFALRRDRWDIASTSTRDRTIELGELAASNCLDTPGNAADCAATLAHETIHLLPDEHGGTLVLDTPKRRYDAVLDRVPTYVVQQAMCKVISASAGLINDCRP